MRKDIRLYAHSGNLPEDLLVCHQGFVGLVVLVQEFVYYLPFLESESRHDRFPVLKAVFFEHRFLIFRLVYLRQIHSLGSAVRRQHILSADNVFFLEFILKPLLYLVLRLGALYDPYPVPAWSLRILTRQDLYPVSVLDLVIDGHQAPVRLRAYHPVAHRGMNAVRKIYGGGAAGYVFYIALRGKTEHRIGKEIEVVFEKRHKLFIVRHILLPLKNLAQPGKLCLLLISRRRMPVGSLLVFPVGRNSVLRNPVHLPGSYLNLKRYRLFA